MLSIGVLFCFLVFFQKAPAQSHEIAQLLLNIEKLAQFKQILSDMKKGYRILNGGYNTIKDLSEGNFTLHQTFLDGLLQVSPTVRNYKRVGDIIRYQGLLLKEYKAAYARFSRSGNFTPSELAYLKRVYGRLIKQSLQNLDELTTVLTSGELRMSDDERLKAIDRIYTDMEDKLELLRFFNGKTTVLAIQRTKEQKDSRTMELIYGLPD